MRERESSYLIKLNSLIVNITTILLIIIFGFISYFVILDESFVNVENVFINLLNTYGYNLFSFGLYGIRFILIVIVWLLMYEIIRGFILGMGSNASIVFRLDKGEIYSKCYRYVYKKRLYFALLVPIVILGIIPFMVGFYFKSLLFLFLAMLTFIFNIKDVFIFILLMVLNTGYFKYREVSDRNKFVLALRKDFDNNKNILIKEVTEIDDDSEEYKINDEYITISKVTLIFLIVLIVLTVLGVIGV